MRTSSSLSLAAAAAALAVAGSAHAVPETLGLSARIVDGGTPVTGPQTIVVRIHDQASGGTPVWTESVTATAADGLVHLTLGATSPLTDAVIDGGPLWVELQVGSTVLAPRLAVTSAPYALRAGVAEDAERLAGQPATAFAAAAHGHAGTYLPVGAALACTGTAKVIGLDGATGSVVCGPDAVGPSYTAGLGLTMPTATSFAVNFGTSGTATAAARADHNHAGVYLPVGATLACPAGQYATGLQPSGSVSCAAAPAADITDVTAGAGLTGGGSSGAVALAVAFGASGTATTVARSDHSHPATCPVGYTTHAAAGATSPLCSKRVPAPNITWNNAATACYTNHNGGHLCSYNELRIAATVSPTQVLSVGFWMGDRVADDWVLRVNGSDANNFDEAIEIVATTVVTGGYYCCQRAQ